MAAEIIANVTGDPELVEEDPSGLNRIITSLESVVAKGDPSLEVRVKRLDANPFSCSCIPSNEKAYSAASFTHVNTS